MQIMDGAYCFMVMGAHSIHDFEESIWVLIHGQTAEVEKPV